MNSTQIKIPTITTDSSFISIFSTEVFQKEIKGGMILSGRIDALNFRLRESEVGYKSSFHVAGDPTMIIIQQGILRITLQNSTYLDFRPGDVFIAKDYLPSEVDFDTNIHGHQASVIGKQNLKATHIKLSQL